MAIFKASLWRKLRSFFNICMEVDEKGSLERLSEMKQPKKYKYIAGLFLAAALVIFGMKESLDSTNIKASEQSNILEKISLKLKTDKVEYGSSMQDGRDLISNLSNASIVDASPIDTNKLGRQSIIIQAKSKSDPPLYKTFKRNIIIIDTSSPVIDPDCIEVEKGIKPNLKEQIQVQDNVDNKLNMLEKLSNEKGWWIEKSDLDLSKPGTYTLVIQAQDSSGNQSSKEIKINVLDTVDVLPVNKKLNGDGSLITGGSLSGQKRKHEIDTSQVTFPFSTDTCYSFIDQINAGSDKLYYTKGKEDAVNALSEIVYLYCDYKEGGNFYSMSDENGTYLLLTDETRNIVKQGVANGQMRYQGYLQYIENLLNNIDLNQDDYTIVDQIQKKLITDFNYGNTDGSMMSFTEKHIGQCYHFAHLFKDCLKSCGIDCDYLEGTSFGESHAWNCVHIDGKDYYFDLTWDITQENRSPVYSFMSAEDFFKNHIPA